MRDSNHFRPEWDGDIVEHIKQNRMRILIMKDPSLTGRQYHRGLEEKGFIVEQIEHGSGALRAMMAGRHDLIIIETKWVDNAEDLLPLEVLRFYVENHRVPVVLISKRHLWTTERLAAYGVATVMDHSPSKAEVPNAVLEVLGLVPKPAETRWAPKGERPTREARAA